MHRDIVDLKDGGWRDKPEFADYRVALEGIPETSNLCADQEFSKRLLDMFIEEFGMNMQTRVLGRWCNDKLLP